VHPHHDKNLEQKSDDPFRPQTGSQSLEEGGDKPELSRPVDGEEVTMRNSPIEHFLGVDEDQRLIEGVQGLQHERCPEQQQRQYRREHEPVRNSWRCTAKESARD